MPINCQLLTQNFAQIAQSLVKLTICDNYRIFSLSLNADFINNLSVDLDHTRVS